LAKRLRKSAATSRIWARSSVRAGRRSNGSELSFCRARSFSSAAGTRASIASYAARESPLPLILSAKHSSMICV
jgi:hypothetical protein